MFPYTQALADISKLDTKFTFKELVQAVDIAVATKEWSSDDSKLIEVLVTYLLEVNDFVKTDFPPQEQLELKQEQIIFDPNYIKTLPHRPHDIPKYLKARYKMYYKYKTEYTTLVDTLLANDNTGN